jgi:aspartate racemase
MFRKLGIVGGVGWRATLDYYGALHRIASTGDHTRHADERGLEISLESLDLATALALLEDGVASNRWNWFDNYHKAALLRLERAEAEVAIIASNTPHERLPQIGAGIHIEIVDLFEAVATKLKALGADTLLVLGTSATMGSGRLRHLLEQANIEMRVPPATMRPALAEMIAGLQQGRYANARARLLHLADRCGAAKEGMLVGLHCTELPLALPEAELAPVVTIGDIRFLNASVVHVEAALDAAALISRPATMAAPIGRGVDVTRARFDRATASSVRASARPRLKDSTTKGQCQIGPDETTKNALDPAPNRQAS